MRVFIVALVFATLALAPVFVRAAASRAPSVLPDCAGKPVARPSSIILACADAGVSAEHVSWTGWGSAFAAGVGTGIVNDCVPFCAAGHFHRFKIVLIADGRQRCRGGRIAYARITYAWIGRSPYPQNAPGTQAPVVPFRCGRR